MRSMSRIRRKMEGGCLAENKEEQKEEERGFLVPLVTFGY